MTEQEIKELNKEMIAFAGLKISTYYPNQFYYKSWRRNLPDFPNDLNACFEWLVPDKISEVTFDFASNCVTCDIVDLEGNFFQGHVHTESIVDAWKQSAESLCLAIEKLKDSE